jgi:hypothetical protein
MAGRKGSISHKTHAIIHCNSTRNPKLRREHTQESSIYSAIRVRPIHWNVPELCRLFLLRIIKLQICRCHFCTCDPSGVERSLAKEIFYIRKRDHFHYHDHCQYAWIGCRVGYFCVGCSSPHPRFRFAGDTATTPAQMLPSNRRSLFRVSTQQVCVFGNGSCAAKECEKGPPVQIW